MSMPAYTDERPTCVTDTECYRNYWSIGFKPTNVDKPIVRLRLRPGEPIDTKRIATIFKNWRVVSFNGIGYDMPMIALALSGASNNKLKEASDAIIQQGIKPWEFLEIHNLTLPPWLDHVDLMEVSPGSPQKPSLKMYAGRLHSRTMIDLPFDPDHILSDDDVRTLEEYHDNDLGVTEEFFNELKEQVELRAKMSVEYGVDVRSKSDAQVAEAVIIAEVQRDSKKRINRPDVKAHSFKYKAPPWVRFKTPTMQAMFQKIVDTNFVVTGSGEVDLPDALLDANIQIGDGVYRMGIGGLHSSESKVTNYSDDDYVLCDTDATSYYPRTILNLRLYPPHIGESFLKAYGRIFERRVAAKVAGDYNTAETLKIVLNGSFGKFGSPYSKLYAPNLMIQTTLTGQLGLLMLIEALEVRGMAVLSANTDGFVTKVPRARRDEFDAVVAKWESITAVNTEEVEYRSLHSRDVNNYLAIDKDGKVKGKGAYGKGGPGQKGAMGMKKNPTNEICIDALIAFIKDGTPFLTTIAASRDIRKFVTIRRVNGGCMKDGELVGKVVRWYYSSEVKGTLTYKKTGNDVPKTEGAQPIMTLPDEFPDDIDYRWYVRETTAMLADLGMPALDPNLAHRTGVMWARTEDQKTFHMVRLPSGVGYCGKANKSLRDQWIEGLPGTARLSCKKCIEATGL